MANINVTLESGTTKNVYNQEADLVMVGPVTYNASNDSVTVTDAKRIYWAAPCVYNPTTGKTYHSGTVWCDYSADPGRIYIYDSDGTGHAYVLICVDRES